MGHAPPLMKSRIKNRYWMKQDMDDNRNQKQEHQKEKEEPGFFREFFSFTKDGKIKSLDLMWALVAGIGILFVYFFAQHFFTLFAEERFNGLSRTALNILDVGVPTVACTCLCCVLNALIRNKKILPGAFIVQLIMELFVSVAALIMLDADQRTVLMPVIFYMFIIPTVIGAAGIALQNYFIWRRKTH